MTNVVHEPGIDTKRVSVQGADVLLVTLSKLDHKIRRPDRSVRPDIPLIRKLITQRLQSADPAGRIKRREKLILVSSLGVDDELLAAAVTVLNAIGAAVAVKNSRANDFTIIKGDFFGRKASDGSMILYGEIQ